jgi:hypothetical protein
VYVEYGRNFNAEIQLEPLPSYELATKLFHELQGKGMVLYRYIHHTEGLEAHVLELDDEDIDILINPSILGIKWWLDKNPVNACSGTLVLS